MGAILEKLLSYDQLEVGSQGTSDPLSSAHVQKTNKQETKTKAVKCRVANFMISQACHVRHEQKDHGSLWVQGFLFVCLFVCVVIVTFCKDKF